jgi:hypothetical protein
VGKGRDPTNRQTARKLAPETFVLVVVLVEIPSRVLILSVVKLHLRLFTVANLLPSIATNSPPNRWMEGRDWLKRTDDNGKKPVKQIVAFKGERFDVMSAQPWWDGIWHLVDDASRRNWCRTLTCSKHESLP